MIFGPLISEDLELLSQKQRLERFAALLVEHTTGLSLAELDPGGGSAQLPDFEFLDTTGQRIGVLEVTTTTREARARFGAQVRSQDWSFQDLMWSWIVQTEETADPRQLNEGLSPVLLAMEQSGPPEGWLPSEPGLQPPDPGALPSDLTALGVIQACGYYHHEEPGKAWVTVQRKDDSGFFSSHSALTAEVQSALNLPDNLAKLSGHDGRAELFVWLDVGDGAAAAMALSRPPWVESLETVGLPSLPGDVTAVWAATGIADWPSPATTLLHCDGEHWRSFDRPALVSTQLGGR